jgi:galactokinase
VLPAAIQHDVLFAIRAVPSEGRPSVSLENVQSRFKPCSFALVRSDGGWDVDLQAGPAGWGCYMKAVVKEGLARYFSDESEPVSLQIMVSGNVPPGSGLSVSIGRLSGFADGPQSSAAFVVAAVLSFLIANGISERVNKDDLVKLAIASEHRMGLQTGGMDVSRPNMMALTSSKQLVFSDLNPPFCISPSSQSSPLARSPSHPNLPSSSPTRWSLTHSQTRLQSNTTFA